MKATNMKDDSIKKAIDETKRDIERRENDYKKIKRIQELSDELHAICTNVANEDIDWSELPGILEARVQKNCKLD